MKLVYIIIAHTNSEQTLRLVNNLNYNNSSFVFHISTNCESQFYETVYNTFKNYDNCFFARRANIRWGDFSTVQGTINAIDKIIESDLDFDYAVLLSGQDYPIKTNDEIARSIEKLNGKLLLETMTFKELRNWVEKYHFWIRGHHYRYPSDTANGIIGKSYNYFFSLFFPKNRKLPYGYVAYKGSFWWTLPKDCIQYLHKHIHSKVGRNLIKFYRYTYHAAESYFQTILMKSPYRDHIINKDMRFILWPDESGHPKFLTSDDFNAIKSSEYLFGRKFDSRKDAKILDLIDQELLNPPNK